MTTDNTQKNLAAENLQDDDLDKVSGGDRWLHVQSTDKYYRWNGPLFARNGKYLCPRCGRPVHYGAWCRFYCDPCDCSWYDEYLLLPDQSSGNWEETTKEEYERCMNVSIYGD